MKKLSLAMTGLAVLGLMTMVSCRKPNVKNVVPGTPRTVTFNATTESGDGSKTYLDGTEVKWSENDVIYVNGTGTGNQLTLASEPGSTFGSFSSQSFTATAPYMVAYPQPTAISQSGITFTISDNQSGNDESLTGVLPMAAYTTNETDLSFKNMVNVLKLDLGTRDITNIEVESADEWLSGSFTVGTNLTPNYITSGTKKITITKDMTQSSTPQTVYVVLPVFRSSESTVSVKFTGTDSEMKIGPKALTNSDTPSHTYSVSLWNASVVTIPVCAKHSTRASSGGVVTGTGVEEQGVCWSTMANPTIAGSHYVHQYEYATGSLTPKNQNTIDNNTFTGFMSGLTANTTYHVRAYIKKGTQVVYGDDIPFTTPSDEPFPTGDGSTVNFNLTGYSNLEWSKYNLGVDPNNLDEAADWYGDYYQWGDNAACTGTVPNKMVICRQQSYRFVANGSTRFTKYCPSGVTPNYWYNKAGDPDNILQLDVIHDCVSQTLGVGWRMPTIDDWQALYDGTLWVWTDHYAGTTDLKGYVVYKVKHESHKGQRETSGGDGNGGFTGYSGFIYTLDNTHMFLPVAGFRAVTVDGTGFSGYGSRGYYCSSSLYPDIYNIGPIHEYIMKFDSDDVNPQAHDGRVSGYSVRPVRSVP